MTCFRPKVKAQKYLRPFDRGFTLIETLVAVFLLSVGVLISLIFFVRANVSTQLARDVTIACTHADFVFEDMVGRTTLSDITTTDWTVWAQQSGLNALPEEQITVSYDAPQGDPLKIDLTVAWTRKGRPYSINMTTELTK